MDSVSDDGSVLVGTLLSLLLEDDLDRDISRSF